MPDQCQIATVFNELCAQIESQRPGEGFSQVDMLAMPDPLATLLNQLVRRGELTAEEIAAACNLTEAEGEQVITLLLQQGLGIAGAGPASCKAHLAARRQRRVQTDVWKALDL